MSSSWIDLHTKIETLSTRNRNTLHRIQQRKNKQVITGYEYDMKCNFSSPAKKKIKIENETANGNEEKPWKIITTQKTVNVNDILSQWKYEGAELEHDALFFHPHMDKTLESFEDLEKLVNVLSDIGDKYTRLFNEETQEILTAFKIMVQNLQNIQLSLDHIHEKTTDVVDTITDSIEMKKKMDKMIECYTDVRGMFPESLRVRERNHEMNVQYRMPLQDDLIDKVIPIGECTKLKCEHILKRHLDTVRDVKMYHFHGEKYIATSSRDQTVKIHKLSDKSLVATLIGHTGYVASLAIYKSKDDKLCLASCGEDGVRFWDLHENKQIATLNITTNTEVWGLLTFEKDDKTLIACGHSDGEIKIWNVESEELVITFKGHTTCVTSFLVFHKDNRKFLISGASDRAMNIWNLENYELVKSIEQANKEQLLSLATIDYDGKVCIASGGFGDIKIWNTEDFALMKSLSGHSDWVWRLKACEYNGRPVLVSCCLDQTIKFWNLSDNSVIHTLKCDHQVTWFEISKSDDNKACLISGGYDGSLEIWTN